MATDLVIDAPWARKHDMPGEPLIPNAGETLYPHTLEDVIEVCRRGGHLMAAGSHWALSDAAISDGAFVETHDPNNVLVAMGRTLYEVVPGCLTPEFMASLANVNPLPFDSTSGVDNESFYLVHFETGKRVYQLYSELDYGEELIVESLAWKLAAEHDNPNYSGPWAIETMGGAGGQTVFGALTTGTHGGDFVVPPMADFVEAMHLVADGGKHYWIERGRVSAVADLPIQMTSRDSLMALYGAERFGGPEQFEVIRDSNVFNAVLVGAGRFGIVYSVVMRVVRQYMLHEERVLTTWEDVRPLISDLSSSLYSTRFLQLAVCATPHGSFLRHLCGQTKRQKVAFIAAPGSTVPTPIGQAERRGIIIVPADPQIGGPRFEFAGNSHVYSPDPDNPAAALAPNFLELACSNADFIDGVVTQVYNEIQDFLESERVVIGSTLAGVAALGGAPLLLALAPFLLIILAFLAFFLELLRSTDTPRLGSALDDIRGLLLDHDDPGVRAAGLLAWQMIVFDLWSQQQGDLTFDAISYTVLDRHDYLDESCNVNVDSIEVFFDATDPMLLAFVDALLVFEIRQNIDSGNVFSGYISLRFTGPTRALIGMERFGRSCAVEVAGLKDVRGTTELIDFAVTLARDPNFSGILHWGQRNDSSMADIHSRFGDGIGEPPADLGDWRSALSRITDNGRLDGFSSEFTRRVGLEIVTPRIRSFESTPDAPTRGTSLTVAWDCSNNPPGTLVHILVTNPRLLRPELFTSQPLSGNLSIVASAEAGTYVVRLFSIILLNGEARQTSRIVFIYVP